MSAESPLVTVPELTRLLAAAGASPVLLDVRWRLQGPPGLLAYREAHLPGAAFVDLDSDLAGPPGDGGRHPLPAPERFEAAMRRAGVRGDREVVVYDDADATAAARAWWCLRYFGHERVRVLDGGFAAWVAAGGPVEVGEAGEGGKGREGGQDADARARPGDFVARSGGMPVLDADGAAGVAGAGVLLDARTAARYRGEVEPIDPVAGHIPGAVSAPTTDNVDGSGRFLTPERLRERFARLGVAAGAPTGAYCGSGVTAAHEVLALDLAGVPAALYVGSWSHWVTDPARPVATGADPA